MSETATIGGRGARRIGRSALLALAAIACWLLLVWLRTGSIPAPSNGDEVWSGESAWWLLRDGVLRSDWHQDAVRSEVRDFFPPVVGLLQAAAFAALGVDTLALSIWPPLLISAIVAMLALHLATPEQPQRALLALAPFAFPQTYQAALMMRFEICIAFFVVVAMACLHRALRGRFASPAAMPAFGAALAAAAISYYQVAPALLAFGAAVAWWVPPADRRRPAMLQFVVGAALPFALMAVWIHPDWRFFIDTMRRLGGSYAFGYEVTAALVAVGAGAIAATWALRGHRGGASATADGRTVLLIVALIGVLLLQQYLKFTRLALISALLLAWAFVFTRAHLRGDDRHGLGARANRFIDAAGWAFAAAAIVVAAATAYVGLVREPRDYARFAAELRQAIDGNGIVVADNRAWLALRPQLPAGRLIHLVVSRADPAYVNRSLLLERNDDAPISTVALRSGDLAEVRELYPAIDRFVARADVEGPIVVGSEANFYRLEVYRRRRAR